MYDKKFFDVSRQGMQESAAALVPRLCRYLNINETSSLIDVGCGEGWFARQFAMDSGCEVLGIDGDAHEGYHPATNIPYDQHDLREKLLVAPADFVVCLEVAEHLPEYRARSFVAELCGRAKEAVIFSAAIPGQGGTGHVNEQWPDYWEALFAEAGFAMSGAVRFHIWNDDRIENWYRQNLMIAVPTDNVDRHGLLFDTDCWQPFPLVHPVLYDARRK